MTGPKTKSNNLLLGFFFVALFLFAMIATAFLRIFPLLHDRKVTNTENINTSAEQAQTELKVGTESEVKVIVTGDIMLGREVMYNSLKYGDFTYPFLKVAGYLKSANITFVNLENPIIENCREHHGGYTFCSPPSSIAGLLFAGIDIVSLANNHTLNYGKNGLDETVRLLAARNILSTGVEEVAVIEHRETKFGFLGFDKAQQGNPILEPRELELVRKAESIVDVLIVGMHWGVEYQDEPLPGVRRLARELVENGADVIVGHHPHWVQGMGCFRDGAETYITAAEFKKGQVCPADSVPVFYSLGNFIFDQMWSEETKKGAVVELTFKGQALQGMKVHNTYIRNFGQVEIVNN